MVYFLYKREKVTDVKRYSKKRESIIKCLRETDTHPTAEWIFGKLKDEYPDLSLGTVYRNLSEMVREGSIISLGTIYGKERFDGRLDDHSHVICKKCGKISDVENLTVSHQQKTKAEKQTGFVIDRTDLEFFGLCRSCCNNH